MTDGQTKGGMDISSLSAPAKMMAGAGILYIVDLFLPWWKVCVGFLGVNSCGSSNGIQGFTFIGLIVAIVVVAMLVLPMAGVKLNIGGSEQQRVQIHSYMALALPVLTLVEIITSLTALTLFAWVGLVLSAVVGYGGWTQLQASKNVSTNPAA